MILIRSPDYDEWFENIWEKILPTESNSFFLRCFLKKKKSKSSRNSVSPNQLNTLKRPELVLNEFGFQLELEYHRIGLERLFK